MDKLTDLSTLLDAKDAPPLSGEAVRRGRPVGKVAAAVAGSTEPAVGGCLRAVRHASMPGESAAVSTVASDIARQGSASEVAAVVGEVQR